MRTSLWLLSAPLLVLVVQASAQTTRGTATREFAVTIDVSKTCVIDAATDISFGTVSPGAVTPTASGNIQVRCSAGTDYTLGLNQGLHEQGDVRHMQHATLAAVIPYTLSSDSGHAVPWGNAAPNWVTGQGLGVNQAISHPVYARATLTGDEPPGTYEDLVTATLTF